MVREVDLCVLSTHDQIADWLKRFTAKERNIISSRAILRIFASVCLFDANDMDGVILRCSRCLLVNCLLGHGLSDQLPEDLDDIEWAAESAVDDGAPGTPGDSPADAAGYAAAICSSDPDLAAIAIEGSIEASGYIAPKKGRQRAIDAILSDVESIATGATPGRLWPDGTCPKKIEFIHLHFLDELAAGRDWEFWRDWYLGMWDGTFDNWDLAQRIVMIEEAEWDRGKAAVGKRIRLISVQ